MSTSRYEYDVLVASPPLESPACAPHHAHRGEHGRPRLWIGAVQYAWQPDSDALIRDIEHGVALAVERGAQLVCLPELTLSPYFCASPPTAEASSPFEPWLSPEDFRTGSTMALVTRLALRHSVFIQASVFERADGVTGTGGGGGVGERGFNTAFCVGPDGSLMSKTRKMHIPVTEGYREDLFFDASDAATAGGPTPLVGGAREWVL